MNLNFDSYVDLKTDARSQEVLQDQQRNVELKTDKMFLYLLLLQWWFAIACAIFLSPRTWDSGSSQIHMHVYLAIFLGGALTLFPAALIWSEPGKHLNGYVIAISQMMMSSLLIHLTGGRIETQFHIFGSLAFLASYRNWKILALATGFTAADHFLRGIYLPETIFGLATPSTLSAVELTAWLLFEDVFLLFAIKTSREEMVVIAARQSELEKANGSAEHLNRAETLRAKNLLRLIIDSIPTLIAYINNKNEYAFINSAYSTLFGDLIKNAGSGYPCVPLNAAEYDFISKQRNKAMRGEYVTFLFPFSQGDGTHRDLELHYIPDVDDLGEVRGMIVLSHDISERLQTEKTIEKQRADITTASRLAALGEMAGGVAHEINTPLASLQLLNGKNLRALTSDVPDINEMTETTARIGTTIKRISNIVMGMKSLSRNAHNEVPTLSNLYKIISDTLDVCREKFKLNEIDLIFECDSDTELECRSVQISQVMLNLLNNAFDAVQAADKKWIRIKSFEDSERVYIHVSDSGATISDELKEKIFQPFFTTKGVGKGTGIGLSISKTFIESHDGSLTVETLNHNTTFIIILPKKQKAPTSLPRSA